MLIEIKDLSFSYNHKPILNDVSLNIYEGEQWAIIGKNGAGKSTLIKCIAGLEKTTQGQIIIAGKKIETYSAKDIAKIISYVPQVSNRNLPFTVFDYVMMGRFPYQGFMAIPTVIDRKIVLESLQLTDTEDFSIRKMNTLSGGELQRVLLAGAVAQKTPILILDEPTTFLDPFHQQLIIRALERIHQEFHTTIIAVTHEISSVIDRYSNVLGLKTGEVVFSGQLSGDSNETTKIYNRIFDVEFEIAESKNGRKIILQKL
jgi:ABC-type cobalamin/Fe3+-siderophores transport systems, ATPase components